MRELFSSTTAYRTIAPGAQRDAQAHFTLVLFPDGRYLRDLLTLCAEAFFGAAEGSRVQKLIAAESYADCLFYPAKGAKLTADGAADLIGESALRPVEGSKKLFVLDAFQTVTPLVQNKLLKILEEPPESVYFLAGATAEHAVLPTVLSRADKIAVPPFPEEAIAAALTRKYGDVPGIAEAAAACGGIFSAAEDLLEGGGAAFRLAVRFLTEADMVRVCREIGDAPKGAFLPALRLVLRDVAMYAAGQGQYAVLREKEIKTIAARMPAGVAIAALRFAASAEREIQFNANPAQAALTLALRIAKEREIWQKLS